MARGDYTRRHHNWRNDPELTAQHRLALAVVCRYCHQLAGARCVRLDRNGNPTTTELENMPAHPVRVADGMRSNP